MPQDKKQANNFLREMRDWQNKQYLPGAYTGADAPFPVKQFGKKKWYRLLTIIYLIIFFAAAVFALVNMVISIVKRPNF